MSGVERPWQPDPEPEEECYDCQGACAGWLAGQPCTTPRVAKAPERRVYCDCGRKLQPSDPYNLCARCEGLAATPAVAGETKVRRVG